MKLKQIKIIPALLMTAFLLTAPLASCKDKKDPNYAPLLLLGLLPRAPAAPSGLSYTSPSHCTRGYPLANASPTVTGTVTGYSIDPALPAGLSIDASTGVIGGAPSGDSSALAYTITATNSGANTTAAFNLPECWRTRLLGVAGGSTDGSGITADGSGNVYATGYTTGNLDGQTLTGTRDMFVTKYDSSGVKQWTRLLGSAGVETWAHEISADGSGNVYAAGYTFGNLDGQTAVGSVDMFLTKYDSSGVKQWTRLLGIAGAATFAYGATVDGSGNVYAAGYTSGNLDGETLTGTSDMFLTKYDSSVVRQWTRLLGTAGVTTSAFGVTADGAGNVYVTGYTDGNLDGQTLTGTRDLFVTKYNASGVRQWTRLLGVAGVITYAQEVRLDAGSGDVYVTGFTEGNLDGQTLTGTRDMFLVKYNSFGVKQWTRLLGVAGGTTASRGTALDGSGNVYAAGRTTGNLDGQTLTGTWDLFVTKYNSSGVKQWTRLLGVAGAFSYAYGLAPDGLGNVYAAGFTEGNLDGQTLTGTRDMFLTRMPEN